MANQTLVASGTEINSSLGQSNLTHYNSGTIDLAGHTVGEDVIINVPSNFWTLNACIELVTSESTATVIALDLGTGNSSTLFVDGFDAVGGSAGDFSAVSGNTAGGEIGGTLNVDLQAVTGVVTECQIKVHAVGVELR